MHRVLNRSITGFPRLVVIFACAYVAIRFPAFRGLVGVNPSEFEPVGVLWFLRAPLPAWVWFSALGLLFASGAIAAAGRASKIAVPVFAGSVLVVTTYRSSWGQLLWFENLLVIHLVVIAAGAPMSGGRIDRPVPWTMQWCAVATIVLYALAGLAKLRYGGVGWVSGDVLANHIGYSSARLSVFGERPPLLASFAVAHPRVLTAGAVATVALELAAPLTLLGRRLAIAWSGAMWTLHVVVALTMAVVFPYPMLGLAFIPVIATAATRSKHLHEQAT